MQVVGPDDGPLAEGESGPGRMAEPAEIVAALAAARDRVDAASLAGLRVVVSAGPTYEDLDPVRFIGNRSSGKMGFAIAAAAARRGADVVLVAGPGAPADARGRARASTCARAAQMHAAVLAALPADVYIGAAAVADFTPRAPAANKIKKVPERDR